MIVSQLALYFSYDFVRYAFLAGILIAVCASLLGVILVLKRYSYIGDGLSHTAFGALAIASVLKLGNLRIVFILPVTILCAIIILQGSKARRVSNDAIIAMVSVTSLAFGYILMNRFSVSANVSGDVCSTLFGSTSILTLSRTDVLISAFFALAVTVLYLIFYRQIFSVTFDERFAAASGLRVNLFRQMVAIVIAVIVVLAMELVGTLLIAALIIFPSVTVRLFCKSFYAVSVLSAILAVCEAVFGMILSILVATPIGSTIVMVDAIVFFVAWVIAVCLKL